MFKDRVRTIKTRLLRADDSNRTASGGGASTSRAAGPSTKRPSTADISRPMTPIRPARPQTPDLSMITPDSPTVLSRVVRSPEPVRASSSSTPMAPRQAYAYAGAPGPGPSSPPSSPPLSPVTDRAWFVPVPVLDKRVYAFEYQFGGTIGEGGFGKVLLALNIESRAQYAIKVVAIRRLRSRRETASIANEIKVLWRVGQSACPFLVRPACVQEWYWQYRGNVHIVMEYYKGGDLGRNPEKHVELKNPNLFKLMVVEVVLGILALHDMGIIHHDVKPSNILIAGDGHCVLTDYGGSLFISPTSSSRSPSRSGRERQSTSTASSLSRFAKEQVPIFTMRYAAPEVLLSGAVSPEAGDRVSSTGTRGYGTAVDFWSLGVTLFELATGKDFYDDPDDDQVLYNIQHGRIDLSQLELLSSYPGLRPFVSALLVWDPSRRLQGQPIKAHSYFADFAQNEWIAIQMKQRPPFSPDKQAPLNPRNTSYDYVERPGESLLDDANEDIVARWLHEAGISIPHHRDSQYHHMHGRNARVGVPEPVTRTGWVKEGGGSGSRSGSHRSRSEAVEWVKSI